MPQLQGDDRDAGGQYETDHPFQQIEIAVDLREAVL